MMSATASLVADSSVCGADVEPIIGLNLFSSNPRLKAGSKLGESWVVRGNRREFLGEAKDEGRKVGEEMRKVGFERGKLG